MRTTIRTRILSVFIGVFLVQALIVGSVLLYQHNMANQDRVKQQLQATADNISAQVSSFCQTVLHDLATASHQVERIAQKNYQRYHLLNTLKNNNPAFSALAFYDINGIVQSAVFRSDCSQTPDFFNENSDLFYSSYNSGKPYVAPLTSSNNLPAIGMSQPVFFLDKAYVVGVISALVPLKSFQPILDRSVLAKKQNLFILDKTGRVVAGKLQEGIAHSSFPPDKNWYKEVVIDQTHYISSAATLDFHGQLLTIVSTINAENSITPSARSFMLLCSFILILLLLSTLVGWTTYKRIIEPIQILAETSATMIGGKEVDLQLNGDAELQELAVSLGTINQQLLDSNKSLALEVSRRRHEERRATLAKIEAEKGNQAKSIFLANMSHELRSPLHGMLSMLKMLKDHPLSQEQAKLLATTTITGERLQTVVDSILDLSQIESGKFQLHHSSFVLSELLTEVVELMRVHAKEKGIRIRSKLQKKIPPLLMGDSGRIRQILINLVTNAIKFSDHGTITLEVQLLSVADETVELEFRITDCGHGISESEQQDIFSAFKRGTIAADKGVEGTGLGLAISNEFVQHMDGKLWLEETGPEGSAFCFTILCTIAEESLAENKEAPHPGHELPLTDIRIMLAEDEFINQRIITAYLEEQGALVTVCQHGRELLNKMQQQPADIILMDIRMPVMNGLEATKIIRKQERDTALLPIPIIALTAQATVDFEEKCKTAGMDDYLTKPIPFDRLVETIYNLVNRKN